MCLTSESIFLTTAPLWSGKCRTSLATLPVLGNGSLHTKFCVECELLQLGEKQCILLAVTQNGGPIILDCT